MENFYRSIALDEWVLERGNANVNSSENKGIEALY